MSDPSLRERVYPRKSGEQFIPWRGICGFYPPDIVARQRDLGDGPKRLYERLVRWAGQKGTCWYSFETMAAALGKCVRQLKSDMAVLEGYGLVQHQRRGKRLANRYTFLWHPIFDKADVHSSAHHRADAPVSGEMQAHKHHQEQVDGQVSATDGQVPAPGAVHSSAHEFCTENSVSGNASSSQGEGLECLTAEPFDDEPSLDEGLSGSVSECLLEFVRASGIQMPAGSIPVVEIASGLASNGATVANLVEFLKEYAGHWRGAPATWRHVFVSFQRWASDPKTHHHIELCRAWKEKAKTPPVQHICGRCKGRGVFATSRTEWAVDHEQVTVLTAYACSCSTGWDLTSEDILAKEAQLAASYKSRSTNRTVADHCWPEHHDTAA